MSRSFYDDNAALMSECTLGETAMTKYQYPSDVEAAMDRFVADNPGAGWQAIVRAFERAILQSMREGELRRTMISEKNAMKREACGDCGVKEGQLHIPGCDIDPVRPAAAN